VLAGLATVAGLATPIGGHPASYQEVSKPWRQTCAVTGARASCPVNGLTDNDADTFTAEASNAVSTSDASPASNSVTPVAVPGRPRALWAAVVGPASVWVSFTAPTPDGPVDLYIVTASPGGQTCTALPNMVMENTCVVSGLAEGTVYTFTAAAVNSAGVSPQSQPSNSVMTPRQDLPPGVPAAPVAFEGDGQATVNVGDPSPGGAPDYYIVTSDPGGQLCQVTIPAYSCTVTGLTEGVSYTFTSTATNLGGTSAPSAPSNTVTLAAGAPGAPASVAVRTVNGQVRVDIAPPSTGGAPDDIYTVTADPGSHTCTTSVPENGQEADCAPAGLIPGTTYTLTATVSNPIGTSPPSATVSFTVPTTTGPHIPATPSAPTGDIHAPVVVLRNRARVSLKSLATVVAASDTRALR
jgi:hypothetical protein